MRYKRLAEEALQKCLLPLAIVIPFRSTKKKNFLSLKGQHYLWLQYKIKDRNTRTLENHLSVILKYDR